MTNLSLDLMSQLTHHTKYGSYVEELQRREVFKETATRNMNMHIKKYPFLKEEILNVYEKFVFTKKVLPSMRSMQFGGKSIELNEARIYNCAFMPIDSWIAFQEIMFLLLSGTGVGYSVQHKHIEKLPSIRKPTRTKKWNVSDDIIGWSDAVRALMRSYLDGSSLPRFEFREIRKKGTPLKTSGGKAPGFEPLKRSLEKVQAILDSKDNGSKLTPLEVHDICCHIADAVLAGGIRRAAMICLFNIDDGEMIKCKSNFKVKILEEGRMDGNTYQLSVETIWNNKAHNVYVPQEHYEMAKSEGRLPWWYFEPQRARSNNSAVFVRHRATKEVFDRFWKLVRESGAGEPGILFTNNPDIGVNPCCEISLRAFQFCNLNEINASNLENGDDLIERAKAAAFLGTLQAGYTDFHYLRDVWEDTTKRDALLGASMTGTASVALSDIVLQSAANGVIQENKRVAKIIGIKPAARLTTVKPSGTTSLILGTSSGCHAWFDNFYIRRIKVNKQEPIYLYLQQKLPQLLEDDRFNPTQDAFICIPMKAPEGAVVAKDESALQFLERVKHLSLNWVKPGHVKGDNTHNVSATVYVKENEWTEVGEWMWDNREVYNGLSVLPFDGHTYIQAPHESITEEKYEELSKYLVDIDLSSVSESGDNTSKAQELACAGGLCEVQF